MDNLVELKLSDLLRHCAINAFQEIKRPDAADTQPQEVSIFAMARILDEAIHQAFEYVRSKGQEVRLVLGPTDFHASPKPDGEDPWKIHNYAISFATYLDSSEIVIRRPDIKPNEEYVVKSEERPSGFYELEI